MGESTNEHVWYVCYGSNLRRERFECYMTGDIPPGSNTKNPLPECDDREEMQVEPYPMQLPFGLCFGYSSKSWQGAGVAFLDLPRGLKDRLTKEDKFKGKAIQYPKVPYALGRAYRITKAQFVELVIRENGLYRENGVLHDSNDRKKLDHGDTKKFDDEIDRLTQWVGSTGLEREKIFEIDETSWSGLKQRDQGRGLYRLVLRLGMMSLEGDNAEDEPVFTFTSTASHVELGPNNPSEEYLLNIVIGILETYREMSNLEIRNYLERATRLTHRDAPVMSESDTGCGYFQDEADKTADFDRIIARARECTGVHECQSVPEYVVDATQDRVGANREFIGSISDSRMNQEGIVDRQLVRAVRKVYTRSLYDEVLNRMQVIHPVYATDLPPRRKHAATLGCSVRIRDLGKGQRKYRREYRSEYERLDENTIQMDQKIRLAIGVNKGDVVMIQAAPDGHARDMDRWWVKVFELFRFENLFGVQAQLMRVELATSEDMEIRVARTTAAALQVLGIESGDHVSVSSVSDKKESIRILSLTDEQVKKIKQRRLDMPDMYPSGYDIAGLQRVKETTRDGELPILLIDSDFRGKLSIKNGDVVRVVRNPRRNLGLRPFLIFGPSAFLAVELGVAVWLADSTNRVWRAWLAGLVVMVCLSFASFMVVFFETRRRVL
ncbi:MAG: hypothetical protein JKY96_03865 [Phycisphaerales bacterium]|nr:hypothetical protein [Phycisphaerales bacterium]